MNISKFFIVRPVATTLLMLALLFSGLLVWRLLPVSALPQVDYPIIQVYTFQPGANPDTVQRTITAPLEREMGKIAGLKQMSSQSSVGASVTTLQFELSAELGVVEQEVQSALVLQAVNYQVICQRHQYIERSIQPMCLSLH